MALNFVATERKELTPRITVFGVGGAGGNAVNNMIDKNLEGVEFVVANTDAQALQQSQARSRIQLGVKVTEGLGAGARPTVGASAAEETLEEIIDHLSGAHMCFITAGMGGGTGTGAAPIIAQAAREMGVLTVGVVTKPFSFEGVKRMRQAEEGVEALQKVVDTLIIIPNQNLFRLANEKTTFTEAFALADDVLYQGVKGVTDLMVRPGMINLDFADVRAVMDEMGKAMMGTGEASGEDRARVAAEKAIANPLLDEISLNGARGVLINITGGQDLTLFELDEAANLIREKVDPEANIIVGSTLDPAMEGMLRVSVVATGIEASADAETLDVQRRRLAEPLNTAPPAPEPEAEHVEELYGVEDQADEAEAEMPQVAQSPAAYHDDRGWRREAEAPVQDTFDLDEVLHEPQQQTHRDRLPAAQRAAGGQAAVGHHASARENAYGRAAATQRYAPIGQPEPAWQPEAPAQPEFQRQDRAYHDVEAHPGMQDHAALRRQPGEPSQETLRRLQEAVRNQPGHRSGGAERAQDGGHQGGHRVAMRPAAPQAAPIAAHPASHPAPAAEHRPRFGGLGSLIGRMTGQGNDMAQPGAHPGTQQGGQPQHGAPRRAAPNLHHDDDHFAQPQDDRIEMPAFLRRQAN